MFHIPQTSYKKFKEILGIASGPRNVEQKLWEKVYYYIPPLRYIPGVLLIGIGNSLSMNACHSKSDIDVFVITKKKRLWSVRILLTIYFSLLRIRKTRYKHTGRFCLSFFVTDEDIALNFQNIAIDNDIYLYFWILYMKPIINKNKTYEKFLAANTNWCDYTGYEDILTDNTSYIKHTSQQTKLRKKFFTSFGDMCENMLKTLLLPKTQKSFLKKGKPFGVIVSDNMLKFHDMDTRREIRSKIIE